MLKLPKQWNQKVQTKYFVYLKVAKLCFSEKNDFNYSANSPSSVPKSNGKIDKFMSFLTIYYLENLIASTVIPTNLIDMRT